MTDEEGDARTGIATPLAVGALVAGRYRLEEKLGAGGFGAVWRARHTELERDVALKVLHPELARDPELQKRFLREIEVSISFVHRYAVQVRDAGRDAQRGLLYLTMDLVAGRTLAQVLRDEGPFVPARAVKLVGQALEVLEEAQRMGLVHRDLKPHNLMLTREGDVRVLDFGIARAYDRAGGASGHTLTASGAVIGTLAYMSPEQAQGMPLDGRSDVYAMGVVLYEALSKRLPIEADPSAANAQQSLLWRVVSAPPRDLNEVAPEVPAPLRAVAMRALEKDPARRFADATAFREALLASSTTDSPARQPVPLHPDPPPRPQPVVRSSWRRIAAVTAGAGPTGGVLCVLLVWTMWLAGWEGREPELVPVWLVATALVTLGAAVLTGLEELVARTTRARSLFSAIVLAASGLGAAAAGLSLEGSDRFELPIGLGLIGGSIVALGLARLSRWGNVAQLALLAAVALVDWALASLLFKGILAGPQEMTPWLRAGELYLIAGLVLGSGLSLAAGDALARSVIRT